LLSSWSSGFASIKPTTAVCLAALGVTLVHPGKDTRVAFAVGLAVATLATLDLFDVDFGINRLLVPRGAVPGPGAASFRMLNGKPVATALAGSSLALSRLEGHHFVATALAGLVLVYFPAQNSNRLCWRQNGSECRNLQGRTDLG
jgi:hypothetical protein